jgi:hypothetical protein
MPSRRERGAEILGTQRREKRGEVVAVLGSGVDRVSHAGKLAMKVADAYWY